MKLKQSVNLSDSEGTCWTHSLGFWSALITTLGGVIYFVVILVALLTDHFTYPPSNPLQLFGGISSLVFCPALVILMACLHTITPAEKKVFSQISLAFTLLFAVVVSINRFTQLGVVRQSITAGRVQGVDWFLPYGDHSIMLGLEMMGWGWFLGLAMLFTAPLFAKGKLELWLCGLLVLYGVLGLVSSIAYLLASPLSVVGFVAWGLILFIITALLAVHFKQVQPTSI
ncbi:hypothetical protein D4S03_05905 [bacterium]|nr:MAG: hypothetical protein D4S03_05905 [bacterium]